MRTAKTLCALAATLAGAALASPAQAQFCDIERLGSLSLDLGFEVEVVGPTLFGRGIGVVQVIDVSDPAAPVLASSLQGIEGFALEAVGNTLYIADFLGSLRIFDVSDPYNPVQLSQTPVPGPEFIDVVGGTAVVASRLSPVVTVFDVTDPAAPVQLSELRVGDRIEAFQVEWPFVYLSNGDSLITLDIGDPANPQELGRFESGLDGVFLMGVQGPLAFARENRDSDRLLRLVHVDRPEAMRLFRTGTFDFVRFAAPYQIEGDWLITSGPSSTGVTIHSLEDFTRPRFLGGVSFGGSAAGFQLVGDRLYAVSRAGVEIFDIGGCPPYRFCPADLNSDGVADFFDAQEFSGLFTSGQLQADFDGDGELTANDLVEFQAKLAAGCP